MFAVLGKLGWFFKAYWKRYTIALVLLAIVGVLEILPPWLIGVAIDEIRFGLMDATRMWGLIGIMVGLTILIYGITFIWMYQLFGGAFVVERLMRSRYLRHLLNMTPHFFERNRTGDLMAKATNDLKAISMTAGFGILTLMDSTIFMLTILSMMAFLISWKLTLAALLPLPIMAFVIQRFGKAIHRRFMAAQDAFGYLNDRVLETIAGVRVLRAYVKERDAEQQFADMSETVYKRNLSVARIDALFDPTIKILVGISYLIGIGYGAMLVFRSEITLGELVSFNVYLGMLIWPMFAIGQLINVMQRGNASLDRVQETLDEVADVHETENPEDIEVPGNLSFQEVTFRYPSADNDQLKGISFQLERGKTLGVVGKTGSGKTTLLKQLLREYPGGEGSIRISGIPLERLSLERLRGWIGYVPQEHILFSKTVEENIQFGDAEEREREQPAQNERVDHAIRTAALDRDIPYMPQGLHTLVGEKGVALSGGQKQRVSIARAILTDAEILLLDDAMSAVDGRTEADILRHIRRERKGKTTLIATHRLSAVQHADHIIVLDNGQIIEEGTHQQLMEQDGWYKEQFQRQQMESDGTEESR